MGLSIKFTLQSRGNLSTAVHNLLPLQRAYSFSQHESYQV